MPRRDAWLRLASTALLASAAATCDGPPPALAPAASWTYEVVPPGPRSRTVAVEATFAGAGTPLLVAPGARPRA
jgi:hypothetical protein